MAKTNHRTPDEWRELLDAQQRSGLNQTQFCKRHQISRSAFFNAKDRLVAQAKSPPPAFIAVSPLKQGSLPITPPVEPTPAVAEPELPPVECDSIKLTLAHCSLQFPLSLSPFWLATLLRELTP
ncbi:hypothetical protein A6J66_001110 [Yersinia enterocolitica]|nr:hypothetical protein A6J66_018700 [Yersinia enterocolitica]PNM27190.1 hypothetical protein A6J66_000345 [Yersinia enterocolitica]PNM27195.1 hypothetical protein A6J66_000400 [Yersinia enterocolitica]PNM27227.1 hypothetical protein A6J66_000635 [Yersinia enterocolitica]PNM27281.1 hypothetical protein A6J66_001060 [Yersinia enterocolitica]